MSKQDFLADKRTHMLADMIAQCDLVAAPPADLALWGVGRAVGNERWTTDGHLFVKRAA